ncbi:MAG: type II toxin-antitoxin system VapB family antitoxin [Actinomycetota bacterium]
MRTTLDIDDELMRLLLSRHPGKSKTEAVEEAIRDYLANDANARIDALRGAIEIVDVSEESRRQDRHT